MWKDILIIVIGILFAATLSICIINLRRTKERKEQIAVLERKIWEKQELDARKKYELENELNELNILITAKYKELTDAEKNYVAREKELREVYDSANAEMKEHASIFAAAVDEYQDKLNQLVGEYNELVEKRDQLEKVYEENCSTNENLKLQVKELLDELIKLKEDHRLAVLANQNDLNEGLWELQVRSSEVELIKILERIKIDYPELKNDISTIEWKKIWLPKMQDLCGKKGLDGKCGIYRLVLKSDENICYVGQAVNIKERWYQHIKKMIGVEAKGGEKLYEWRPEDFWWSVLEECENKELNDREKYWIEFYACKEVGLNKRV